MDPTYRGVSPTSWGSTWRVRIQHRGQRHDLGTFSDAKEAARAYDRAASRLGKKYRNFPDESPNTDTGS